MEQSPGAVNPQVSLVELTRLATLFDCEGSVTLTDSDGGKTVILEITMAHEPTVRWASGLVARLGVRHYFQVRPARRDRLAKKPQYVVRIRSLRTVKRFSQHLAGHILTKSEEMAIAMEYVDFALAQVHSSIGRVSGVHIAKNQKARAERAEKFLECRQRIKALRETYPRGHTRYSNEVIEPIG